MEELFPNVFKSCEKIDLDGNLLITNDRFRGMTVRSGRITLPDAPGLGLVRL